jgi:hypothetical protein
VKKSSKRYIPKRRKALQTKNMHCSARNRLIVNMREQVNVRIEVSVGI